MPDAERGPMDAVRAALGLYKSEHAAFAEARTKWPYEGDTWKRHQDLCRLAAQDLWVTGLASFFDILTTNYKAQERLLDKQLELAEKSAKAADRVAWWTMALVIVTGILIIATVFTGLFGVFHR